MHRAITLVVLLALAAAPAMLSPWGLSQLTFVAIYVVAGTGLMLLAGHAGQLSLCHAAFIGVGAYVEAVLHARGWPLPLSLLAAMALASLTGIFAAWPARKLSGIYLAIATLSFGFIMQEILMRWESVTAGNAGLAVTRLDAGRLYWLALATSLGALWLLGRLLAGRLGRAFVALREDATAATAIGIAVPRLKVIAFALAAAFGGLAGALYAHQLRFVSPEQFDWVMSIELLMMLVIGGLGTRTGIVLGAVFLIALPQAIALLRDTLAWETPPAGIELFAFGFVLVLTLRFAPNGLSGLAGWLKKSPSL